MSYDVFTFRLDGKLEEHNNRNLEANFPISPLRSIENLSDNEDLVNRQFSPPKQSSNKGI